MTHPPPVGASVTRTVRCTSCRTVAPMTWTVTAHSETGGIHVTEDRHLFDPHPCRARDRWLDRLTPAALTRVRTAAAGSRGDETLGKLATAICLDIDAELARRGAPRGLSRPTPADEEHARQERLAILAEQQQALRQAEVEDEEIPF